MQLSLHLETDKQARTNSFKYQIISQVGPYYLQVDSRVYLITQLAIILKNIVRLQMTAWTTSYQLSRCQVVLNKRLLSEVVLFIRIIFF